MTILLVHYMHCPQQRHSYRHTALSEIFNRIVGKNISTHHLISHTIFSSNVGLTNIIVQSMGQSGAETKYGVPTV